MCRTIGSINKPGIKPNIYSAWADPWHCCPVAANTLRRDKCTLFTRQEMVPEQIWRCLVFDKCWAKCCCAGVKRSRNMEGNEFFFFLLFLGRKHWQQTNTAGSIQTNTHFNKEPDGKSNARRSCIWCRWCCPLICFKLIYFNVILHDSCFTIQPHFPPPNPSCLPSKLSFVWTPLQPPVSSVIIAKLPLSP